MFVRASERGASRYMYIELDRVVISHAAVREIFYRASESVRESERGERVYEKRPA